MRNGYARLFDLSGGDGPALNGGNLAIDLLELGEQRVFLFGQLYQLSKRRAWDVRQHIPHSAQRN
jgi:hypothetical protein